MKILYVGKLSGNIYVINPRKRGTLVNQYSQRYQNFDNFLTAINDEAHRSLAIEIDSRADPATVDKIIKGIKSRRISVEDIVLGGKSLWKQKISRN